MTAPAGATAIGAILPALHAARSRFGRSAARAKLDLLHRAAACALRPPRDVRAYHDCLLFIAAHPDDDRVLAAVRAALDRVAAAAARRPVSLRDSGIAGTVVECSYTLDLAEWIARRSPEDAEVAWDDGSAGPELDRVLAHCAANVEGDGLLDERLTTEEWVRLAKGSGAASDLEWLLRLLRRLPGAPALVDHVVEKVDLPIRWSLADPAASLTFARFPPRPLAAQQRPLRRRARLRSIVARRLPPPRALSASATGALLDAARAALAARRRETDPVTYANPREIALFALEDGVDVAIIGLQPARRLPIESFFGYVLARNRVPMAYGGSWVFLDRAEIGINVFDAFRGGESAHLFAQIMRVYRQHFGARRFLVDPYQIGADNTEAIRSGAYWFYDRLGFRPTDPALRALAAAERRAIGADRAYRTPARILRRLAGSRLAIDVARAPRGWAREALPDLAAIGLAVTAAIGRRFGGDRDAAERWARRRMTSLLGARDTSRWPPEERAAFDRLCPLMAFLPGVGEWPRRDLRALLGLMRAKGGPRERDYARGVQRHARLRQALTAFVRAK
jgi:hypothetical protein